ncbi:MAG: sensor domain-containing diguanylate cyclase [Lachnospiraceae bacterium]|nr:sensor domain-containing diguanylate cyclase [Lachnospiraceae bacterium]
MEKHENQDILLNMRKSIELYYDFIIEEFPLEKRFIYDKEKFKRFFGTDQEFNNLDDLFWFVVDNHVHKDDLEKVDVFRDIDVDRRVSRDEYSIETEFRVRLKRGTYRWISAVTILLYDEERRNYYVLILLKDINKKKMVELESTILARRDAMTRLYNKTYTEHVVKEEIEKLEENANAALIILDIDNFKNINDTYGHMIGDHVIIEFASRLLACTRETDIVGRIGGDEFLVFIPNFGNRERLLQKITKMQENLRYEYSEENTELQVHCSMGIAVYRNEMNDYLKMFQCADKALYISKKTGKDAFHIYE